ncbi:MAG: recombinase family protein [Oscillospiraceae bacterium]|nr:recombinase family protein [Oscillospiraceae bacterium]
MEQKNDERLCAAIYARFSSHSQKDTSIEQQLRECREYARMQNINVICEYADHAITGKTDRRPEFQRMIKDSAKHRFQYVIVYTLDRFSRNRYDAANYKAALKRNGVRVLSAKENISDAPEGIILESVLEGMAEYYSAELARKIRRGMEYNAEHCLVNGITAYGFEKAPDGKYAICEEENRLVRFAFESYDSGMTMPDIANYFESKGYKTRAGKSFSVCFISKILHNPIYRGVYTFGKVQIENGVPRTVDDELFFRVEKRLSENKHRSSKSSEDPAAYLLTGKLFCGLCGSPMVGDSGTSKSGRIYRYYSCISQKRKRSCKKRHVPQDILEKAVLDYTVKFVLSDDMLEFIADEVMKIQDEDEENSLIKTLESELLDVRRQLNNINNAIAQGIFSRTTKEKLDELEAAERDLLNRIDAESIEKPHLEREQVLFWLNRFRSGGNSPSARSQIIDAFINSIYVFDDHLIIAYNYSSDKKRISLKEILEADSCSHPCSDEFPMVSHRGFEPRAP